MTDLEKKTLEQLKRLLRLGYEFDEILGRAPMGIMLPDGFDKYQYSFCVNNKYYNTPTILEAEAEIQKLLGKDRLTIALQGGMVGYHVGFADCDYHNVQGDNRLLAVLTIWGDLIERKE